MPRIARMVVKGEPAIYHIISRTALDGYVIGDVEKDYLLDLIKQKSAVYFAEVVGFSIMCTHFHLLVKMHPGEKYSNEDIKKRFGIAYGKDRKIGDGQVPFYRKKWEDLSEYVKEIKQGFSRYYNKLHNRKGFFWSDRFKSVIVEKGETLVNCLAYIDLNPVRADIVEKPEAYRWNSIGYHVQRGNKDNFLSMDFGLNEFGVKRSDERLRKYRDLVYEKGGLEINGEAVKEGCDKFRYRTRYFADSGIIGTKAFVNRHYQTFKGLFSSKHEKRPKSIGGLGEIYSLKRLSEQI